MNNAILIQQAYPGRGFDKMLELTHDRHAEYCKRHEFDFQSVVDPVVPEWPMEAGAWAKVVLIERVLEKYHYVVWLDADTLIADMKADLREACSLGHVGACWHRIPQLDHWNVGALYICGSTPTGAFIRKWLEGYPGLGDGWNEQGVFNKLAKESDVVNTISDRWNATLNVNMVPDAAVLGFHGPDNAEGRLATMKSALEFIARK